MVSDLSPSAFRLLNAWQHGFPLVSRPFRSLGLSVGLGEHAVLEHFQHWTTLQQISRIGPVLNPACMSSTLAALQVPAHRLQMVADQISALPEVNHNYEREHPINLWFVMACADTPTLHARLNDIARLTGLTPISLPMLAAYHIDLGFSLTPAEKKTAGLQACDGLPCADTPEHLLLQHVQHGLALVPEPFQELARLTGLSEKQVLKQVATWLRVGLFRRFGVVLHHRALGYQANAMCVWTVPDTQIDQLGTQLGQQPGVTLCYQRRPHPPEWPHNLFCMIHGQDRRQVLSQHAQINRNLGLDAFRHDILFSSHCFKQRGARIPTRVVGHD
ncbi:siroheme decarboxylase subunit beta [Alcaligenes sp. SDU_A2]|uniref:siroheme decarboxylase subunit beta n=1 Tax=Alcaligenes sp. SDU_A2 TaxID=3136634 RepID=UPI00311DAAC1